MTSLLSRIFSPVARCAGCGLRFRLLPPSSQVTVFDEAAGQDRPVCPGCDPANRRESSCADCGERIVLLGGAWHDSDGGTCCYADPSPRYTPHIPEED